MAEPLARGEQSEAGRAAGVLAMLSPALRTPVRYGVLSLRFFICRRDDADTNRLCMYFLG